MQRWDCLLFDIVGMNSWTRKRAALYMPIQNRSIISSKSEWTLEGSWVSTWRCMLRDEFKKDQLRVFGPALRLKDLDDHSCYQYKNRIQSSRSLYIQLAVSRAPRLARTHEIHVPWRQRSPSPSWSPRNSVLISICVKSDQTFRAHCIFVPQQCRDINIQRTIWSRTW